MRAWTVRWRVRWGGNPVDPVKEEHGGTPGLLAGMGVFVEAEGQQLPGPNYRFLGEYKASKEDILRHRLKVKGSLVVDADGEGHHHDGEATEEEKRAVMCRLEGYDLTHESCCIIHLPALRREGFGSPLNDFELSALNKKGDGAD